jgi:tRNA wybutosine-synthesizing protein 4
LCRLHLGQFLLLPFIFISCPSFKIIRAHGFYLAKTNSFVKWEEFAIFGCHYFLLVADNAVDRPKTTSYQDRESNPAQTGVGFRRVEFKYSENKKSQGLRRFAAALPIRIPGFSGDGVGNFAGMGLNTRVTSCDLYVPNPVGTLPGSISSSTSAPSGRMCKSSP